jgi:nucleoside-diphosphate-sugar epimerase
MNILITGAASELAQALASHLSENHQIRLTDIVDIKTDSEFMKCDLGHDEATNELVRGMDSIIHLAELPPDYSDDSLDSDNLTIDFLTRCTYNLLWAAVEENVKKAIYGSTLKLFDKYDDDLTVNENWRPLPSTDPYVLGKHLGEFTCKEFARTSQIQITCLRYGEIVRVEDVKSQPYHPAWIEIRDLVHAFECALGEKQAGLNREWSVFHIEADAPDADYPPARRARGTIGFNPKYRFRE